MRGSWRGDTRRLVAALTLAGFLTSALTACGEDQPEAEAEDTSAKPVASDGLQILRLSDAQDILLSAADAGNGFVEQPDIPDLESDTNGCLGIFDQAQTNQQFEVESQFVNEGVTVTSQVTTYSSIGEPKGDILRFRKAARSCKNFEETRDGIEYDVNLIFNETATNEAAQDQLNLAGSGTITEDGNERPLSFRYTLTRIENNVVGIQIASIGPNPDELPELVRMNDLLVDRLIETAGLPEEPEPSETPGESEGSTDAAPLATY